MRRAGSPRPTGFTGARRRAYGEERRGDPCGRPGTRVRFFAALRMTGTGGCPAGDGGAGGAEPRPYGVDGNAEIIKWAIRESPLRGLH